MEPIELRCRREALGLLQRELAVRLGVAQNTLSQWESGARQVPDYVDGELAAIERDAAALVRQFARGIVSARWDSAAAPVSIVLRGDAASDGMVRMAAARAAWQQPNGPVRIVLAD